MVKIHTGKKSCYTRRMKRTKKKKFVMMVLYTVRGNAPVLNTHYILYCNAA